jgi:hypothetical protein
VLPHIAEVYISISRDKPVDPIKVMANFLEDRGTQMDKRALDAARKTFYDALDKANEKEARSIKIGN